MSKNNMFAQRNMNPVGCLLYSEITDVRSVENVIRIHWQFQQRNRGHKTKTQTIGLYGVLIEQIFTHNNDHKLFIYKTMCHKKE